MTRISPAILLCALALGLSATIYAVRREKKPNFAPLSVAQADSVTTLTQQVEIVLHPLNGGATRTQTSTFSVASNKASEIKMSWTGGKFSAKTADGRTVLDYAPPAVQLYAGAQSFAIDIKNSIIEKTGASQLTTSQSRSQTVTVKRGTPAKELF